MGKQAKMLELVREQFDNQKGLLETCSSILGRAPEGWQGIRKRKNGDQFRHLPGRMGEGIMVCKYCF